MERKVFSIKKAHLLPQESWYNSRIVGLRELENVTVKTKDGEVEANLFEVSFDIIETIVKQRYFQSIDEGSKLGEVIKAINYDEIPDEINDLEAFLVGKELNIRIAHNVSKTTGRTFANPVEYCAIDAFDEELSCDEDLENGINYRISNC